MLIAGRYRLEEALGRGGMGEVWRAVDEALGRPVAVKLLLHQGVDDASVARFRLEAQTAARLSHPNVVAVYDFGADRDRLYLVMELLDGRSLAHELAEEGTLSPQRVVGIGAGVAAGLAVAHRAGVVHRDIKPANLLLASDGSVKIGDFGIARFADESAIGLTATGQVMGTSSYLAPERALGRAAGPPADIYALGCVLYQLLTGRPPFQADTATAVVYQHVDAAPASLRHYRPDLPEPCDTYVLAMLAKDPDQRPTAQQAADTFTAPLTAWNPPVPPPAPTPPLPTAGNTTRRLDAAAVAAPARQQASGRLNTRRSRAIVGAVVAGTIAAVTVATIAATSGNDDYKPPSAGSSTTPATHSPATTSATSTGPAPVMTTATKATPSATHSTHTKRPAGKATPSAKKKNPPHAKKTPPPPRH